MAEQRNQTPAGDNTQWTTVIRPRTGWFDVDLEELWRYRDLIVMFVKRNFTVMYKQTILGPAVDHPEPAYHHGAVQRGVRRHCRAFYGRTPSFLFYMARQYGVDLFCILHQRHGQHLCGQQPGVRQGVFPTAYHPHQPGIDQPDPTSLSSLSCTLLFWVYFAVTGSGVHLTAWAFAVPLVVLEVMLLAWVWHYRFRPDHQVP